MGLGIRKGLTVMLSFVFTITHLYAMDHMRVENNAIQIVPFPERVGLDHGSAYAINLFEQLLLVPIHNLGVFQQPLFVRAVYQVVIIVV